MARFYATIKGNRGEASRMGSPDSGIYGHIRGWDVGVRVIGAINSGDVDFLEVYLTGGSNGHSPERYIGRAQIDDGYPVFRPAPENSKPATERERLRSDRAECQNCRNVWPVGDLDEITHGIWERVSTGEEMPAGECPACGALAHLTLEPVTDRLESAP